LTGHAIGPAISRAADAVTEYTRGSIGSNENRPAASVVVLRATSGSSVTTAPATARPSGPITRPSSRSGSARSGAAVAAVAATGRRGAVAVRGAGPGACAGASARWSIRRSVQIATITTSANQATRPTRFTAAALPGFT